MKSINTLLLAVASISTLVAAETSIRDGSEDTFTISARDLDLIVRDSYTAGHEDAKVLYMREPFPPQNHPTFPQGSFANLPPSQPHQVPHRQWNDPTPPAKPSEQGSSYFPPPGGSSSRVTPGGRNRAGSFKRDLESFEKRFPPANHPTFPQGSFANLPPSQPHQVPHRQWNDPTPPAKPSEQGSSYFPPPGGSSSRVTPGGRNRAGSFKRSEMEDM